jgi:hypothetical protein
MYCAVYFLKLLSLTVDIFKDWMDNVIVRIEIYKFMDMWRSQTE